MDQSIPRRNDWRARKHAGWWAFAMHRLSGVALAMFLPLHFLVLGRALNGAEALDGALAWTAQPVLKASEVALVFFLAAHLAGGVRLLLAEFAGWNATWQPTLIAIAGGIATMCALVFALNLA